MHAEQMLNFNISTCQLISFEIHPEMDQSNLSETKMANSKE